MANARWASESTDILVRTHLLLSCKRSCGKMQPGSQPYSSRNQGSVSGMPTGKLRHKAGGKPLKVSQPAGSAPGSLAGRLDATLQAASPGDNQEAAPCVTLPGSLSSRRPRACDPAAVGGAPVDVARLQIKAVLGGHRRAHHVPAYTRPHSVSKSKALALHRSP